MDVSVTILPFSYVIDIYASKIYVFSGHNENFVIGAVCKQQFS